MFVAEYTDQEFYRWFMPIILSILKMCVFPMCFHLQGTLQESQYLLNGVGKHTKSNRIFILDLEIEKRFTYLVEE
jgi:hypothetical protein